MLLFSNVATILPMASITSTLRISAWLKVIVPLVGLGWKVSVSNSFAASMFTSSAKLAI